MDGFFRTLALPSLICLLCGLAIGCDSAITGELLGAADPGAADQLNAPATTPPRPADRIRVATFNIQTLGPTKMSRPQSVSVIADIIRRFDIVAIQELRSSDASVMERLVEQVNAEGGAYRSVIGPRLGRTSSKEQYVYVYDSARISVDQESVHTVYDPYDRMHREPFLARFIVRAPPPQEPFSFLLVNVHTDPDEVEREMNVLDEVYRAAAENRGYEDDVIVLGDFNASYQRLGQLGQVPGLITVIREQTTNTRRTESYDNIVLNRDTTTEFLSAAGVLDFEREYALSPEEALQVSDHFPVWAEFSILESPPANLVRGPNPTMVR